MLTKHGEMAERSKAHAWKVCMRDERIEGSNPSLSASQKKNALRTAARAGRQCRRTQRARRRRIRVKRSEFGGRLPCDALADV